MMICSINSKMSSMEEQVKLGNSEEAKPHNQDVNLLRTKLT